MGLLDNHLRFVLDAKANHGVAFTRTATLGRHQLLLSAKALHSILRSFGYSVSKSDCVELMRQDEGFADALLRFLGAEEVKSFDASSYEGASHIHDFNKPIDPALHYQFDLVLDSGSLEHIFIASTAIKNCMEMVRVGGHLIVMNPANNNFGHGFYQFSPEFYYQSLTTENGFEICRISVFEGHADPVWYDVIDPETVGRRAEAVTRRPTMLAVVARRTAETVPFAEPPQQSDYMAAWLTDTSHSDASVEGWRGHVPERGASVYRWARSFASHRRYPTELFRRRRVTPA